VHIDTARSRIAVKAAERERNARLARVDIGKQGARGVRRRVCQGEVGRDRAEERCRTRCAAELLEDEEDLAQPRLGRVGAEC